jgi:hypothetical protein
MSGVIARLNAALSWDLDDFDRGTAHIGNVFNDIRLWVVGLGVAFESAGRKMTLAVTGPLVAMTGIVPQLASKVKELENSARLAGAGFDEFQRKAHAAQSVGVGMEKLADIFKDTQDKLGEFASTGGGELMDFFENIAPKAGVTIDMFKKLSGPEALQLYYNSLAKAGASSKEIVFYLEAIADEGSALIPLLAENGKLMRELGDTAPVFTDSDLKSLKEFTSAKRSLATAIERVTIAIARAGLTDFLTDLAHALSVAVDKFANLSPETQRFILKCAALAAAIGPVMLVLGKLASFMLPLLLLGLAPLTSVLGRVLFAVSALINPFGTMVVAVGKIVGEMGGLGILLGRIAPLFLRIAGPIGIAIALFTAFKDNIADALATVWNLARDMLGPRLTDLFDKLGVIIESIANGFDKLAGSPIVQFLGDLIGVLIEIGGSAVIAAIATVIDLVNDLLDVVMKVAGVIHLVFAGEWQSAWALAASIVDTSASGILESIARIFPPLNALIKAMEMAGLIEGSKKKPTGGLGKAASYTADDLMNAALLDDVDDGTGTPYAPPSKDKPKKGGRGRSGRSGPSAEELAARREEIRLQQQLDVAREKGDTDTERALRRQLDLHDRQQEYMRAGLNKTLARAAAEKDMLELDEARAVAQAKAIATDERQFDMQLAELRGDYAHLRSLEDEEFIEREIERLKSRGVSLAEAERLAQQSLLVLEAARADQAARRLADQQAAHDIELSRLRGDSDSVIRAKEEADRRRQDADAYAGQGMSREDAIARATRESMDREKANLTGTFRDTFRNGLRAAMDGDLGSFFENWMKERSFNALAKVLDRLATNLADFIFNAGQANSGGGGGGFLSSLFRFGKSSTGGGGGSEITVTRGDPSLIGFDTGGSFRINGFPGIDNNTLSLNGNPVARVSQGEIMDVRKGNPAGSGVTNNYFSGNLLTPEFWAQIQAGDIGAASAGARGGAALARQRGMWALR